eukprot:GAHX01001363.1.p1 GENE.GAHX01001363.1~~GAHX01001363.1.p1  ORF type:complete len:286 (-),score=35.42 GAHX01001363.1:30-887(-)
MKLNLVEYALTNIVITLNILVFVVVGSIQLVAAIKAYYSKYCSTLLSIVTRVSFLLQSCIFLVISFNPFLKKDLFPGLFTMFILETFWVILLSIWQVTVIETLYLTIKGIENNHYKIENSFRAFTKYIPSILLSILSIVTFTRDGRKQQEYFRMFLIMVIAFLNTALVFVVSYFFYRLMKIINENQIAAVQMKVRMRRWKLFVVFLLMFEIAYVIVSLVAVWNIYDRVGRMEEMSAKVVTSIKKGEDGFTVNCSFLRLFSLFLRIFCGYTCLYFGWITDWKTKHD